MDSLPIEGYFDETMDQFTFDASESLLCISDLQLGADPGQVWQQHNEYHLVEKPSVVPSINPYQDASVTEQVLLAGSSPDGDFGVADLSDACLKFMSEILMEENEEDMPSTSEGFSALQAREKELYDVLSSSPSAAAPSNDRLPSANTTSEIRDGGLNDGPSGDDQIFGQVGSFPVVGTPSSTSSGGSANCLPDSPSSTLLSTEATSSVDLDWLRVAIKYVPDLACHCQPGGAGCPVCCKVQDVGPAQSGVPRAKRSHQRDDGEGEDMRSNKHVEADDDEEEVEMEQYDDFLLLKEGIESIDLTLDSIKGPSESKAGGKPHRKGKSKGSKGRAKPSKKQGGKCNEEKAELMDVIALLQHCAQAVAGFDSRSAKDLLREIRQHSSPTGDSTQRLAHYFANGLEARLDGNGVKVLPPNLHSNRRISASNVLKAYRTYFCAIPFKWTSYFLANETIAKLAESLLITDQNKRKIHIIDLDIFFGVQWPSFIQRLSKTPGGSPELHITGVDCPERGFRPAKAVDETGRRLAGYCARFGVPFKYRGIAKKLETLLPEDFQIEEDEVVVVNSLYVQKRLPDETIEANNPRDSHFELIRKLNPDLFIEGVLNAAFNASFFITRFREALFFYSSVYDLIEATMPCGDQERILLEREMFGRVVENVVACEDAAREERPETYRQWQGRTLRAGFRHVPLDQELMRIAKEKVKANYHKDFMLGEDNHWMIQGWKGRILYALSIWKPA